MTVKVETENCNWEQSYLFEDPADSKILLTLKFDRIASTQSKKKVRNDIVNLIQNELSKFKWIIAGSVGIDFVWYLNATERQETDKIGDIDNISKPIQDSLIGSKGILIDDAQIKGLYSSWMSRNDLVTENLLEITLRFNNDYILQKENLKFIQYYNAICTPLNIDITDIKSLIASKLLIRTRKGQRKSAQLIKTIGSNVDRYLVCSQWDFHRTRLNGFNHSDILTIKEFNSICLKHGLSFRYLLKFLKSTRQKAK